jgi:hypothetical protein
MTMNDLKETLNRLIDDCGIDGVLEALADVCEERAGSIRNVDVEKRWREATVALDNVRLEINV